MGDDLQSLVQDRLNWRNRGQSKGFRDDSGELLPHSARRRPATSGGGQAGDDRMWDKRYDTEEYVYGTAPSGFLRRHADLLTPGARALAIADGEGRNSVFMAGKGLEVTAMDSSGVGMAKARRLAAQAGVKVAFQQADLRSWPWEPAQYDIVAAIFIQFAEPGFRDAIFRGIERTLKPGGLLLLHGYTPEQVELGTGGPPDPTLMYTEDMLRDRFGHWDIQRLEAYGATLDEGPGHSGASALIDLIARAPGV